MDQLNKIADKLDKQSERLARIETDLKHHIRRTDDLQKLAEEFKRYKWMVMGAVVVLGPVATKFLAIFFK